MDQSDVKIGIGGEDTGLQVALAKAGAAVKTATEEMKASLDSVSATFSKLQGVFIGFTAVLAGGAMFKKVIDDSIAWTDGSKKLAAALGVSLEKASDYQGALKHLGIENDVLIGATEKLSKQIYANSAAFDKLGVATKQANGEFRPVGDILQDVINKLNAITDPIARNIAGQQAFGKGWAEMRPLLKLTSDQLSEATARVKALGLEVGPEAEARVRAYQQGLRDVGLVGTALSVQLGQELLPTLTQVGLAFSTEGPQIASMFGEALRLVAWLGGEVWIALSMIAKGIAGVGAAAVALLHLDLAGAKAIMSEVGSDINKLNKESAELWENLHKPIPAAPQQEQPEKTGGPFDPKEKSASQIAALEEQLAAIKANYEQQQDLQGHFQEFSKSMDRDYWQSILNTTKLSAADQISVQRKIATDTHEILKEKYQGELADIKAQESQYKNNLEAKLALAKEYAAKIENAEPGSAHAKQAAGEVLAIEREMYAQELVIAKANRAAMDSIDLSAIDQDQMMAEAEVKAGLKTNAQLIAAEQSFENQRYQIKLQAIQRELAAEAQDPDRNPAKLAQLNQQLLALQKAHETQMLQLTIKSVQEQNKYWGSLFSSMNSGFQTTFSSFLKGTATLRDTITGLFHDIGNAIADVLAKMLADWLTTTIEQAIMGKTSALVGIQGAAALAGANAYASTAAIPEVGPELAPMAGRIAYAEALSYAIPAAAAKGGYDVPMNVNPLTQLHSREMVLPEKLADVIRGMSSSGHTVSPAQKRAGPLQLALHPSALRYTMEDWLRSEVSRIQATT
jgi:hypothetical protein